MTRIHELLAARGGAVSYPSLRRFIVKRNWRERSKPTVRMEDTSPGEVAEADFGRLGMITDPETGGRKAVWAMVIVLGHSRHCFVWPMQRHTLEDVIAGLEAGWAFFGGMPRYLVIDNFPAAVVGADPLHPILTRGFLQYAQHRGFIADPARARHPKDKPKVERNVPYARERFFKGADFDDFTHVRAAAPKWCLEVAGMRIHGTTRKKPLVVFQNGERHTLLPWDGVPYDIAHWRTQVVHLSLFRVFAQPYSRSLTGPGSAMIGKYQVAVVRSITLFAQQGAVWRKPLPVAGAFDHDLIAGIGQPVQRAVAQDGVVKETQPFVHGPVAGDDETGRPMSVEYQLVEVGGLLSGEPVEPEVIEDEQVGGYEGPEGSVHRVVHSGLGHGPEEAVGMDEAHGVSGADGGVAQCLGQEALADASGSHQQDVLVPVQKLQGENGVQQTAVQADRRRPVEVLQSKSSSRSPPAGRSPRNRRY